MSYLGGNESFVKAQQFVQIIIFSQIVCTILNIKSFLDSPNDVILK